MLIIACTFACSLAMAMPISTPPNAMAYATGFFKTDQMLKMGLWVNLFGLGMLAIMLFLMKQIGLLG